MKPDTVIDIPPCPTCGYTWHVTLSELEKFRLVFRGETESTRYRVRCPNCTNYAIITGSIEEDEDA
jgi:hypothetical protein